MFSVMKVFSTIGLAAVVMAAFAVHADEPAFGTLASINSAGAHKLLASAQPMQRDDKLRSTSDALFAHLFTADITRQLAHMTERQENEFRVSVDNLKVTPDIAENISRFQIRVLGLGAQGSRRLDGLFNLAVVAEKGDQTVQYQVTGVLKVVGPVVVATQTVQRGTRIEGSDLTWRTMAWSTLPTGAPGTPMQILIGQKAKALIQEGDAVYAVNIEEPMAVSSGDAVEVTVYSGPGVIIRSRGVARQSGKVGDLIRIEQNDTKKSLSGYVAGTKSVEVRL